MAVFQASGVVTVGGRAAGNVLVSFALASGARGLPTLRRAAPAAVRTDKMGRFVQDGFIEGVAYVAAPSAAGVRFTPERTPLDAAHRTLRLQGTASTFGATGVARVAVQITGSGKPPGIPGVTITFVRAAGRIDLPVPGPAVTAADGTWRQTGFQADGVYNAVASKAGFAFSPAAAAVRPDVSSEFTGSSSVFGVSGRITTAGGAPEPGVTIQVERTVGNGPVPAAVATDGAGAFSQSGFDRASRYRISPRKAGITFDPADREVFFTPNTFPTVLAPFTRHTNLVLVGQVLTTGGAGLVGAVITFTRTAGTGAVPLPVTTTSNGEYRAEGLDAGTTYTVTVVRDQFASAPTQLRANAPGTTTLNLTAFPAYTVSGKVIEVEGPFPDLTALAQLLEDAPGVPGAVVSFHRRDAGPPAPEPVISAADGTFRQRGFELGASFIADASAPGFVGTALFPFLGAFTGFGGFVLPGLNGTTGSPPADGVGSDGATTVFSNANPSTTVLENVLFLLQRA